MDVMDILGRGELPAAVPAERSARPVSRTSSPAAPETDGTRFSRELTSAVSGSSNSPAPAPTANKTPVPSPAAVPTTGPVESVAADEVPPESVGTGVASSPPVVPLPLLTLPTIVEPAVDVDVDGVPLDIGSAETESTPEPAAPPPAFLAAMAAAMNCQRLPQTVAPVEPVAAEGAVGSVVETSGSSPAAPVVLTNWLSQSLGVTPETGNPAEELPAASEPTEDSAITLEAPAPAVPAELTAVLPVAPVATPTAAAVETSPVETTGGVIPSQALATTKSSRPPEIEAPPVTGEPPATQKPEADSGSLTSALPGGSSVHSSRASTELATAGSSSSGASSATDRDRLEALVAKKLAGDGFPSKDVQPAPDPHDPRAAGVSTPAATVGETRASAPVVNAGTISPSDQQFAERLSQYILQSHEQDQQLSVKITPPDLGTIVIRVQAGADGLSVEMEASNASTQQLLTDQLPQLQDALSQMGRPAERIDVLRHETGWETGAQGERGTAGGSQQSFAERREAPPAPRIVIPNPRPVPPETAATAPPSGAPRLMQELNVKI